METIIEEFFFKENSKNDSAADKIHDLVLKQKPQPVCDMGHHPVCNMGHHPVCDMGHQRVLCSFLNKAFTGIVASRILLTILFKKIN